MSRPVVAVIGYGDFAKLIIKHLSNYTDVVVACRQPNVDKGKLKFQQVNLKTALAMTVIIPSMPAQNLEEFFTTNKILVNPKALIVDVCSVKVKPVQTLIKVLPKTNQILATHPLFGPASARNGLVGKQIMLYPVRLPDEKYQQIKYFLADELKLKTIECTPQEHDHAMAYAQGLSHYIGRLMQVMDIPNPELTTDAYEDLKDMKRIQGGDSWGLFQSIMLENPYAPTINAHFKQAIKELDSKLGINLLN